jgi:hypothetical protein
MKAGGGKKIVEKNKSRRGIEKSRERNVEYSAVGYKVTTTLSSSSKCVEGKVYNVKIQFAQTIIQDRYNWNIYS